MQQHAHWCAQVEERVRAEVRALRLDPMHDGTQVLSIIERIGADVVIGSCGTHEEQPSVASDVAAVVTAVHHSICGFGPCSRSSTMTPSKRYGSMSRVACSSLALRRE